MKITITMKNPDCVSDALDDAAKESVKSVTGVSEDEREELMAERREELSNKLRKWVEYSEYITVEIDTDANTAIVKEV